MYQQMLTAGVAREGETPSLPSSIASVRSAVVGAHLPYFDYTSQVILWS